MREIWVADAETDPFLRDRIPAPFIWGAYNGDEYREFLTVAALVEFFKDRDCLVYAHNGGKFDWFFLFDFMEPETEVTVIAGRLAKFCIGRAEFRDSYNLMPMPLSRYKKDEIDYAMFEKSERHKPANWEAIRAYLRNDCVYLFEMLAAFIAEFGLHLTQAGASMKAWEKIAGVKAPNTSENIYNMIAPYYYGGRVECFEPGIHERKFCVIDINSAYPFAMTHLHPYGTSYEISDRLPKTRAYIERAFIRLSADSVGAFPFRNADKSLEFPADGEKREFSVTGWEYLAAQDTGHLRNAQIHEVTTFAESIEFNSYLNHFYEMKAKAKRDGDKARYEFAKRFLNSLYGKFGANPENYSEYKVIEQQYIYACQELEDYEFCAPAGPLALMSKPLAPHKRRYYHAGVAASITGFVRAYLWKALNEVTRPIYCDTDSIACEATGNLPLHAENIGAWDKEAECDYGAIAGKKLYAFRTIGGKWKTASKGVRLDAQQICRIAAGETLTYSPDAPQFSLSRGIVFASRKIVATHRKRA